MGRSKNRRGEVPREKIWTSLGTLKLAKREAWALYLAQGMGPCEAARKAGYKGNDGTIRHTLYRFPEIRERAEQIRQEMTERAMAQDAITREEIRKELRYCIQQAKTDRDWSSAARHLDLFGKMIGAYTQNLQINDLDALLADLSDEQLRAFATQRLGEDLDPTTIHRLREGRREGPTDASPGGEDRGSHPKTEAGALHPLSEAGDVPRGRPH